MQKHIDVRKWALAYHAKASLARAAELWPEFADRLAETRITFEVRGRVAGRAHPQENRVDFNVAAMDVDREHMLTETVPHEVAHIVDYMLRGRSDHSEAWKRVARALGCSAERCHGMKLEPARKVRQFRYVTDRGREVVMSSVRHNRLQRGKVAAYTTRQGERLTPAHCRGEVK